MSASQVEKCAITKFFAIFAVALIYGCYFSGESKKGGRIKPGLS